MSFPNYEGFQPQQGEDGNVAAPGGAPGPGPQGQMQPIESTGGQFPPQGPGSAGGDGGDSKTTLW
jgi:hypothetical protein